MLIQVSSKEHGPNILLYPAPNNLSTGIKNIRGKLGWAEITRTLRYEADAREAERPRIFHSALSLRLQSLAGIPPYLSHLLKH